MNGLQNQLARLNPGLVGSIPTRSRHRWSCLSGNNLGDSAVPGEPGWSPFLLRRLSSTGILEEAGR